MKIQGPRKREEGFTLVEVMIALVVLTVGLLGLAVLTGSIVGANALSRDRVAATTMAQGKMEELTNMSYSSLQNLAPQGTFTDSDNPGGAYSREWSVSMDDPIPGTSTFEVKVGWPWGGSNRAIELRTIRAE